MKTFLFLVLILPSLAFSKVYDCFPFFNELELLKVRLAELDEVVDHFVLVESVETQRGNPKPLYFQENKDAFAPYLAKIIHVIINEVHPEFSLWERENYQRDAIMRGLKNCHAEDIILVSDLDEIPRKQLIPQIKTQLKNFDLEAIGFDMEMFRFQLNRKDSARWNGTVASIYKNFAHHSPQYFRDRRNKVITFRNGGWHFTWMGDKDRIRQKMISVVEGKDDITSLTDEAVEAWISSVPAVAIDHTFPHYIQQHEAELKALGFIAEY